MFHPDEYTQDTLDRCSADSAANGNVCYGYSTAWCQLNLHGYGAITTPQRFRVTILTILGHVTDVIGQVVTGLSISSFLWVVN